MRESIVPNINKSWNCKRTLENSKTLSLIIEDYGGTPPRQQIHFTGYNSTQTKSMYKLHHYRLNLKFLKTKLAIIRNLIPAYGYHLGPSSNVLNIYTDLSLVKLGRWKGMVGGIKFSFLLASLCDPSCCTARCAWHALRVWGGPSGPWRPSVSHRLLTTGIPARRQTNTATHKARFIIWC